MVKDVQQKGRLSLAIKAIQTGQITSIRRAVQLYNVPRTTLRDALQTKEQSKTLPRTTNKLTKTEESTLVQWIIDMDIRGKPPRPAIVRNMANILLLQRNQLHTPSTIGKCWVYRFVQRHPELKSRFSRKYNYQRALCENPNIIQEWFDLVRKTIGQYGIAEEDIYNFDETGFAMGMVATARVITQSKIQGRPSLVQPGNREWVTVVETINAYGWVLPPMIIFAGKTHRTNWFQNTQLPPDWTIAVSDNGWTTDQLGFQWLQSVFEPHTKHRTKGTYRLLILDGHGSHLTAEFDHFCTEHKIVPLCMPPHSSHLLQPLDVSCFSVLKRSYGHQIEQFMRLGIDHIDKEDFLSAYYQARTETYKKDTICNGFKATGLIPYDPIQVLSKLHMVTKTPTPPGSSHGSQSSHWTPQTPHNLRELERQSRTIQEHLQCRTKSPLSPTNQALNQLVKGCQIAMHNAALLANENQALRTTNQKQKRKREKPAISVSQGGILTVREGQIRTENAQNVENMVVEQSANQSKTKAPPRCSLCRSYEHTARRCVQRYSNNQI